ncbi:fe2+ transport protein [Halosegnis sp.]|uniref:DUF7350 domain-containing protein n=1 Tax=Halosegnis sp. TaxID=2864959 RepID=UPI0035D4EA9C
MRRRDVLAAAAGGVGLLAGCSGGAETDPEAGTATGTTGQSGDRPEGVYVQPFREQMAMQGTADAGDLRVALMYTTPHRFWTVTGSELSKTPKDGSIHGMAVVWDPETGRVVPETGLSLEITRDGDLVSQEVIYPMLSQRMGYHYGGNFELDGDGTYTAQVSVGAVPDGVALTGAYADRFSEPASAELPLEFTETEREKVGSEPLDAAGEPGAIRPMEMGSVPQATAPARTALPGEVFGAPNSDDALLATGAVTGDAAARFNADSYLYVSARSRYNGLILPAMGLAATIRRDGETRFNDALTRTLDPELGYHYGAPVDSLAAGDEISLSVSVPPQVARHEGYERAFIEMPDVTVTV